MISTILIFAFLLRIISLNQSLWLDEATTALVAKMPLFDFFTRFMPADFHPPLYYVVIKYWSQLFGLSEISLRMPSVIFGVLTVYVVYLVAKELRYKNSWLPALLLATSGLHVYYSQEARMYAMATFLVSMIVYLFLKKNWMLFSVVLSLLFLTDYLSLLILPALLIYMVLKREKVKKLLTSCIPLGITFVVWSPTFFNQITNGIGLKTTSSNWWNILGPVTFKNILLIPAKFIIGRISLDNKIVYMLLLSILFLLFIYVISKAKNKLIWSWFGTSLALGIIVSFFIPTLTYFRYLFILPAFYLLLSENVNKIFMAVILIVNILTTGIYLFNPKFYREDWREAVKVIGDEKIVFPVNSQKEALIYYGDEKQIVNKEEISNDDKQIWLSRYVWDVFDPADLTRKYIEDLGYNKVMETNFNGVVFFKYANSN